MQAMQTSVEVAATGKSWANPSIPAACLQLAAPWWHLVTDGLYKSTIWLWRTVRHGKWWPIEIDGLPNLKMGGFSMAMLNNQMVIRSLKKQLPQGPKLWYVVISDAFSLPTSMSMSMNWLKICREPLVFNPPWFPVAPLPICGAEAFLHAADGPREQTRALPDL